MYVRIRAVLLVENVTKILVQRFWSWPDHNPQDSGPTLDISVRVADGAFIVEIYPKYADKVQVYLLVAIRDMQGEIRPINGTAAAHSASHH